MGLSATEHAGCGHNSRNQPRCSWKGKMLKVRHDKVVGRWPQDLPREQLNSRCENHPRRHGDDSGRDRSAGRLCHAQRSGRR